MRFGSRVLTHALYTVCVAMGRKSKPTGKMYKKPSAATTARSAIDKESARHANLQRAKRVLGLSTSSAIQVDSSDCESESSTGTEIYLHIHGRNKTAHWTIAKCLSCGDLYSSPQFPGFTCRLPACQGRRFSQHEDHDQLAGTESLVSVGHDDGVTAPEVH